MKKLIIVESPAKIKTITKFLGKDFKVMSTMGHIKDLPSKTIGVSLEDDGVDIEYVVMDKKDQTIAEICKAAAGCDEIFLAPDPDREGEIIAWHIDQEIEKVIKRGTQVHRIWFNEITKPAILSAISNPGSIDMDRVAAQQARRILDRWVGYKVSPILWKKITRGLSAGRVQSVALRLICDREKEIRAFKSEEYWSITGLFGFDKEQFEAALAKIGSQKAEVTSEQAALTIVSEVKKETPVISKITDKHRTKNPNPPFMTSTLQQAASTQLGFSVKKTMQIAQKLYEGVALQDPKTPVALITYMRTDSLRLSDTAIDLARTFITKHLSKEYLPSQANVYATRKAKDGKTVAAQDAHEAIRPIDVAITPKIAKQYLPADEAKLYEIIWKRFVACQMTPAQYSQRQIEINAGKYLFRVTGSTLLFDGFLKVYPEKLEDEDKVILPDGLSEQQSLDLKKIDPKQHFTQPPARYSEASLVKEMEKEGIGRPSTYASILNTIRARSYTTVEKRRFTPTELGMAVTDLLVENLPRIMDIKFTAHMEEDLDKISGGELERDQLLKAFYQTFEQDLEKFLGHDGKTRQAILTDVTCPECNTNKLAVRFSRGGEFLGCSGYPECPFTSNFERSESGDITLVKKPEPELLSETCPKCSKPLRQLVGRFGPFVACSGYPECKYIKQETADFPCPNCGGVMAKKKWRGGSFWGCTHYPKCKTAIFNEVIKQECPSCHWPIMTQKATKEGHVVECANKDCSSNPKKESIGKKSSAKTAKRATAQPKVKKATKTPSAPKTRKKADTAPLLNIPNKKKATPAAAKTKKTKSESKT